MSEAMTKAVREVLNKHARLPVDANDLSVDDDLYAAGMSSFASVEVMLALEDEFGVSFPEEALTPALFQTITAIVLAVGQLASA